MATQVRGGGVTVDGLSESIRALGKLDKKYAKEAKQIFRESAISVQKVAVGRIGAGGNRNKKPRGMIGRSATAKGAGIKLRASRYPYAYQAEFGQVVANLWGPKERGEQKFRRRVSPKFKPPTPGVSKGGYMIQPAIRVALPRINKKASEDMQALITRAMREAGVKGRG